MMSAASPGEGNVIWTVVRKAEKERLLRETGREPYWALGVVLKCASGLLILLVVGLVGGGQREKGFVSFGNASPQYPESVSMAEARKVFNERRARYIEAYPESRVAVEVAAPRFADANADGGYHHYQYGEELSIGVPRARAANGFPRALEMEQAVQTGQR